MSQSPVINLASARAFQVAIHRTSEPETLSKLQLDRIAREARANKICRAEPDVISVFPVSSLIEELKAEQIQHSQSGEIAEAIVLNSVIARLKALIPIRR